MESLVVIADGDVAALRSAEVRLLGTGHGVAATTTAEGLWAALRAESPAAVVLEPSLPGKPWPVVLLQTKALLLPRTRLVIVTAYASNALRTAAREIGATAVFEKPVSFDRVKAALSGRPGDLPPGMRDGEPRTDVLAQIEWEHINAVLWDCRGNVAAAARRLGLPRQTVYRKLDKRPRPHGGRAADHIEVWRRYA